MNLKKYRKVYLNEMDVENREKYNTRPLKTFSDDECKDFELTKNEIPVRYSDLITIKEYIGKRFYCILFTSSDCEK